MTRTRLIAVTVLVLAHAAGASAQTVQFPYSAREKRQLARVDPLDPLAQMAVRVAGRRVTLAQPTVQPIASPDYQVYMEQYNQYLADHAQFVKEQQRPSKPGWMSAMQGISAGINLSHQALDLYEHGIEANALKNAYSGR